MIKTITFAKKFCHVSPIFKALKLLKIDDIYQWELGKFILLPCLKIGITSATFISSGNTPVLTHKLNRSLIGEMIGQASLINLMSMSPEKVAFLIFNVFIIASTSSELVGERKNE